MHTSLLLLLITLPDPRWMVVSFREQRNARDSREGHEKVHPKGPVKDVTDIGHTEFWPG